MQPPISSTPIPFDRLLLATAMAERRIFLTRDGLLLGLGLPFVERA